MTRCNKRAFTVTEILFFTFINIIAIAIVLQVVVALNQDYRILMSYLSSYLRGREVIDIISKDCRVGVRVLDNYAGYTTTDDCLVLKVPSIDASHNIIDINSEFDYIIYRIASGNLWKTVIPGPQSARQAYDNVLKKSIDSLYITQDGVPASTIAHKSSITRLTIWLSIAETVMGKERRVNPGTTVKLMNYEWEFVR